MCKTGIVRWQGARADNQVQEERAMIAYAIVLLERPEGQSAGHRLADRDRGASHVPPDVFHV